MQTYTHMDIDTQMYIKQRTINKTLIWVNTHNPSWRDNLDGSET